MGSILSNLLGNSSDKSLDESLAFNIMAAAASASATYLAATLDATTPEVRRIFSQYTNQCVLEHETMTNLLVQKDWMNPYNTPQKQLETAVQQSQVVVE